MSNFTFTQLDIPGLVLVETRCHGDSRGYFMETYSARAFKAGGITCDFVQDNQSLSTRGVLRGMHFQIAHPQDKLVRCLRGDIFDVAVDLRPGSLTFGKWHGVHLTGENHLALFVPQGFAHGFLVLSETAEFAYKCSDFYDPTSEGGLAWDDPAVGIVWPQVTGGIQLNEKDRKHPGLAAWRP